MPLSVESEALNKQKTLIYPHELCTAAEKQWSSFLETITGSQRPIPLRMSEAKASSEAHMMQTLKKYYGDNSQTFFEKEFSNEYSPTPWIPKDKCFSKGISGLHEEIQSFCEYISPMPAEKIARDCVIRKLQASILSMWPTVQVDVYGSYDTGLYLPTSDIDCVIQNCNLDPIVALNSLETLLKKDYDEVKVLKSKVPIVKLIDRYTSYKIDISINSSSGISSADFVKSMLQEHPNLHCLVLVIKQFLQSRGILESFSGGISSYCLILMIISYLQLHSKGDSNMGMDLLRFLELYGRRFNYTKCAISVANGGSYYPKDQKGTLSYSLLRIEDPFDPSNDVGQSCFGVMKVREEMNRAFQLLCDAVLPQFISLQPPRTSILGRIITIPLEVFAYRNFIKQTFTTFLHPSPSHFIITPFPFSHPFTGHTNKLPQHQLMPQGLPSHFTLPITPLYLPNGFNRIFHLPPPYIYSNNQQFTENPTLLQNFANDEKTESISDTSDSSNNCRNNLTDDISVSNKMKNLNIKGKDASSNISKTSENTPIGDNTSQKGSTSISSTSQQSSFPKDSSPLNFITPTTVLQLISQSDVITQTYPIINTFQHDSQNTTLVPNTHIETRFHNSTENTYSQNNSNFSNKNKYETYKFNNTDIEDDEADTDNSYSTSYEVFTDPPSNYYEKSNTLMRYPGGRGKQNQFRNSHNYAYNLNNYNSTEMNRSNSWHCNINNNNNNVAYIHRNNNNNNNGLMMSSMYSPSAYSSSSRHQHQSRYHRPHKNVFSKNYNNNNNSVVFNNTNYNNFSNSSSMNSFNIRGNNNSYSNNHNYNQNKYKNNKHYRHSYTSSEFVGDNNFTIADSNDSNNVKNNDYNNDSNKNMLYEKTSISLQQRQQKQINTSKKVESKKKNNYDTVSNNSENLQTSTSCKNNRDYVKNSKNKYKMNLK